MIQHLILAGRTSDAIEKTKELFPTLLNDKNLLFALKVRQFIEMIKGTESEIEPLPSPSFKRLSPFKSETHSKKNGNLSSNHRSHDGSMTNLMDIDEDDSSAVRNGNGCVVNGYSTAITTTEVSPTISTKSKDDHELLSRILHFGRELHTLKQQLTTEYGENPQNDKMLQVNSQVKLAIIVSNIFDRYV